MTTPRAYPDSATFKLDARCWGMVAPSGAGSYIFIINVFNTSNGLDSAVEGTICSTSVHSSHTPMNTTRVHTDISGYL